MILLLKLLVTETIVCQVKVIRDVNYFEYDIFEEKWRENASLLS